MLTLSHQQPSISFGFMRIDGVTEYDRLIFRGPVYEYFKIGILFLAWFFIVPVAGIGYVVSEAGPHVSFAGKVLVVVAVALWWGFVVTNMRSKR